MDDLIARLQKVTGQDRGLDGEVFFAAGGPAWDRAYIRAQEPCGCPPDIAKATAKTFAPRYTSSIDAALALVPEGLHWTYASVSGEAMIHSTTGRFLISEDKEVYGRGATPAIALCVAALKARAAVSSGQS